MAKDAGSGFDLATIDKLLTTTRAVRRRLDLTRPVPLQVIHECLELAVQAPTGSNAQTWRWMVVHDEGKRMGLADLYRNPPKERPRREGEVDLPPMADESQQERITVSARYLTERLHEVPVLVVPCILNSGGAAGWAPSIYPAVWSFMLALRSRGLGSLITTVHLWRQKEAADLLGIPPEYVQACLLPVAYYTGDDFKPADRRPVSEVAFLDEWGKSLPN